MTNMTENNNRDKGSSSRAASHLVRLAERGGKRMPVDFEADHLAKLDALIGDGFGPTAAAVIREAINQAYAKRFRGL